MKKLQAVAMFLFCLLLGVALGAALYFLQKQLTKPATSSTTSTSTSTTTTSTTATTAQVPDSINGFTLTLPKSTALEASAVPDSLSGQATVKEYELLSTSEPGFASDTGVTLFGIDASSISAATLTSTLTRLEKSVEVGYTESVQPATTNKNSLSFSNHLYSGSATADGAGNCYATKNTSAALLICTTPLSTSVDSQTLLDSVIQTPATDDSSISTLSPAPLIQQ